MACLVVSDVKKCSQTETKSMHKFCRSPLSASRELISCGKNERITIFRNERCFETKQRHTKCDAPQAAVTGGAQQKKTRFGSLENSDQVRNPDRNGTKELTPLRMAQH